MTVRFPGKFSEALIQDGVIVVMPRPHIKVTVSDSIHSKGVNFLIDTGCDQTTLHPFDAYRLWGYELLRWDFEGDQTRKNHAGVSGLAASVVRDVRLSFSAEDDRIESLSLGCRIDVAQPDDRSDPQFSNWNLPSLLGRDVLAHFRLEMEYLPTAVVTLSFDDERLA